MLAFEVRANPMTVQTMPLPEGDAGTEATIAQMRRLIDEGSKDPVVHELAAQILQSQRVAAFDFAGEARAVYQWVLRNIRFTRDIRGKETLHAARETLRLRIGDCDDFTILMLALAQTIGHRGRIVTVSSDANAPDLFSHVYPEVLINGRWIALDAARRNPGFGVTPAHYFRKRVWDSASPEFQDVQGLGIVPVPTRPLRTQTGAPLYSPPPMRSRRRRPGLRGLGQVDWSDPATWTGISSTISAGSAAAANIIAAARATPYNLVPTTSPAGQQFINPALYSQPGAGSFFGMNQNTLLLLALLGVGIMVARR